MKVKNRVMNDYEQRQMIKHLVQKFDRDMTIVTLNNKMKELEIENGKLKSEIAELESLPHTINKKEYKARIRLLEQENRDLKHQLIASGVPIPKKYI